MQIFSSFEKKIIEKIIDLDDKGQLVVLNNILEYSFEDFDHMYIDNIDDCQCTLNLEADYFHHKSEVGGVDAIREIFEGTNRRFLILSNLFNYLLNHKLIIASGKFNCDYIGVKGNTKYATYNNLDIEVAYFIWENCDKRFTPTQNLRKFVRNGYKTDEDIAVEKQVEINKASSKKSNSAMWVSIASLFVSIIIPLFVTAKVEIVNDSVGLEFSKNTINGIETASKNVINAIPKNQKTVISFEELQLNEIINSINQNTEKQVLVRLEKKQVDEVLNGITNNNIVITEEQFLLITQILKNRISPEEIVQPKKKAVTYGEVSNAPNSKSQYREAELGQANLL